MMKVIALQIDDSASKRVTLHTWQLPQESPKAGVQQVSR
jgi:hypothetical protein